MSNKYFAIERNNKTWMPVMLQSRNGDSDFSDFLEMTYDEMKSSENLEEFVIAAMEATNEASGTDDDQTVVTLVGEDGFFIWGIMMGPGENYQIQYCLIDWLKDGNHYRYEPEKIMLDKSQDM